MTTVTYDNAPSGWNEALPLGNGHFGGMVYYEEGRLTLALNHYEVYYRKLRRYSRASREGGIGGGSGESEESGASKSPGAAGATGAAGGETGVSGESEESEASGEQLHYGRTLEQLKRLATEKYRDPGKEAIYLYGDALNENGMHRAYGKEPGGVSHYPTGELQLLPSAELDDPESYSLQLDVGNAVVRLRIRKGERQLEASLFAARDDDTVVTEVSQTAGSLLESAVLTIPARRYLEMDATYHRHDETTFYYMGSFYPDGEDRERYGPFTFLVLTKLIGAKGDAERSEDGLRIRLREAGERLTLLTTVVTEAQMPRGELLQAALRRANGFAGRLAQAKEEHRAYWSRFWRRSSVTLPDKLLEDLWRINLYAIACCSGKGGGMPEQACGLNGLWDIKQPTKWGSLWYWDVNIQAAFWPLYTANRLEIAEAFNDGLLSYAAEAERMAGAFYGVPGAVAGDYPHALYLGIWPWCAQFLWDYYRYGMDESFLREMAYPLFRRIARFFEGVLEQDAETGRYGAFPDISPEQGPLTRNSTCTLASVKYMLQFAAEANERLGEAAEDARRWRELAERLADYPTGRSARYGDVLLDSEWAPADLRLRHPSLLMPIYPIGEIDRHSDAATRRRAENTLRYAAENTEFGMFQFGWLSCAASRLGRGDTALRLLYEQGIDLSLRCNGLFAEETERWMNYCNITNEPLYHPHMMEASGELVAAVNEMLLQSYDGAIAVFPAVPRGEPDPAGNAGEYEHSVAEKTLRYGPWNECSFRDLLAVGGFEVSASRKDGRTAWVGIRSLAGSEAVLRDPFGADERLVVARLGPDREMPTPAAYERRDGYLRFDTVRGGEYAIYPPETGWPTEWLDEQAEDRKEARTGDQAGAQPEAQEEAQEEAQSGALDEGAGNRPRVREAHTRRRVFFGKDRDTAHYRLLDHFTFDYYAGNARESRLAAYRLDFGVEPERLAKDYRLALPRQVHVEGVPGQTFRKLTPQSVFAPRTGIGWENANALVAVDRGGPDLLRRDFVGGTEEAVFVIELPRGRYDVLIVTGDETSPSWTVLELPGLAPWKPWRALRAGEYETEILPLAQRKDGCARIRFRSEGGLPWRINLLVVNRNYGYL